VRGVQQLLLTQRAPSAHSHATEPHALLKVVLHWLAQLGSAQHCPPTQLEPPPHPNVREPQVLLNVPQNVGLGRAGSSQHVPAPPSALPHESPLPQELALQVRSPQLLLSVVLHAAPSPPQVGKVQHAPTVWPAAFLQI
jgi:hypothetical protein